MTKYFGFMPMNDLEYMMYSVNPEYLVISSKAGRYGLKEIGIAGLIPFIS